MQHDFDVTIVCSYFAGDDINLFEITKITFFALNWQNFFIFKIKIQLEKLFFTKFPLFFQKIASLSTKS
ncbi:hypothetical protein FC24_GL000645 [Loigolactobacillus rennini DSM 20253]|uniref:Uncharacterized protein n=1 Tax=Loigolactobacillus rennini DSM 20253 TaxID=1423796 RepID=A0A0R2D4H1_9LACO|nr:hypothetical protein FC24_GL000645 [Loigolactobacillus rennini DSM 20253]